MICWVCESPDPSIIFEKDLKTGQTFIATVCAGCFLKAFAKIEQYEKILEAME